LINTTDVVVRVQEPAAAPPDDAFKLTFEIIDIKAENITQFTTTPEQWFEIRELVESMIHKRLT